MKIEIREGYPAVEVVINCSQASDETHAIVALLQGFNQKLSGTKEGQTYLIDKQEVLYFEAVDKRCFIYTANDTYETQLRLYEIEELLSGMGFFRCSKSQIVNIASITSLCPDFGGRIEAVMDNGEKIIVSRQYAKSFKERLGLR